MRNILLHLIILVAFSALFVNSLGGTTPYIWFVIGVSLGFSLLFIDRILHVVLIAPETEFSQIALTAWKQKQFGSLITLFSTAKETQQKLLTRSAVFILCYCALAIYVLTSTTSVLGAGTILGLGLHYCVDLWSYRNDMTAFYNHFLWQIQRNFSQLEITGITVGFTIFFVILCILLVK